jgi:hypothetical protein
LSYDSLKSRKRRIFFADELHTRAVEVREAKEAVESTRAGLSPQRGDVRKKRKKRKNQGRWSVATRRGGEKNKKGEEKKNTKVGKKVAPAKARFRVP